MAGHKSALAPLRHGQELQVLQRPRHLSAVWRERTRTRTCPLRNLPCEERRKRR